MIADASENTLRGDRRWWRWVVGGTLVVLVAAVVGVIGTRNADARAKSVERRLAASVAPLTERDAGVLLFRSDDGKALSRLQRAVGEPIDVSDFGSVISVQIVGWSIWAPRCVVAKLANGKWTTSISSSSNCPSQ